ncbi:sedoheptulose 7-phosphate cyclase [Amycolatopsis sp. PS_44_ISF1]|uniref:sedoheptulose 7-phosphate cyclase n=1 Tax=Amycolatopsis sp. PS_44_ISF1 TaxID=2974917 RepID=UPI0028DD9B86|nr:sedoheptulose 7-phosphate cyclase [Amycolatopsis sp. PS_44_ISF1]MDT8914748.1 sedoheptulose 7-phosphate cyclase [Amycolatopsis sp. PS_44_ISF1]
MSTEATHALTTTDSSFAVEALQPISYTLTLVDGVFDVANTGLAETYREWNRCLAIVDATVAQLYGERIRAYFEHHGIALVLYPLVVSETGKTLRTAERIVDVFGEFGLVRKEPVLVVGGGLTTDVAGFACAVFRRSTNYIRVPTTLIGLIDASVAIKVAVNHGSAKNRLGAFHASHQVLLDFSFLRTLPAEQIRNGMAELVKIATVGNAELFELLEKYAEDLVSTRFGHLDGTPELRRIADRLTHGAIRTMLELEVPNLHELDLDRVIAFGHTWSPTLELTPAVPFFHGHAISVDMALSTTIAQRRGYISAGERDRILWLLTKLGLSLDSEHLTPELLARATAQIVQTRDGRQRAAVPRPIGHCDFVNDLTEIELTEALSAHRQTCRIYDRDGIGLNPFLAAEGAIGPAS